MKGLLLTMACLCTSSNATVVAQQGNNPCTINSNMWEETISQGLDTDTESFSNLTVSSTVSDPDCETMIINSLTNVEAEFAEGRKISPMIVSVRIPRQKQNY